MKIVVGITGGIAAYKVPMLVRLLRKAGHEVRCAATQHALQFVTPATLETLSGAPLYGSLYAAGGTEHISVKEWAEMLVVAPATANFIGKMASGIADDALSTLAVACSQKVVMVCPAMNSDMWAHPAVQRNLQTLAGWGIEVVEPGSGQLACGAEGKGRMAEPEEIAAAVEAYCQRQRALPLKGQRWLVTAGPTYERIDAVRFIGNYSSGKMGFAIAEALSEAGAEVELIAGPTPLAMANSGVRRTDVESAREMYEAATSLFPSCHGAILAAAVADYRPATVAANKLKKQGSEGMTLQLVQNPDILATLGTMKQAGQTLVGFALETDNEVANAEGKLQKKNLDHIVLNSLRDEGAGFGVDTNKVTVISRAGNCVEIGLGSKRDVARQIVKILT